ncbi:MAG: DUF465 domain-containing protein [Alphaproteobacteria bacterium]|nr:DUF465 domain-containing protein [Alphaproteobacteria bacterium]
MSESAYLSSLKSRHAALDRAILEEERHPAPDDLALKAMKRRKLRLKEAVNELSQDAQPHAMT